MGPLRSGPRSGTGPWGQYKTPEMGGTIRADAREARFLVEYLYKWQQPQGVELGI